MNDSSKDIKRVDLLRGLIMLPGLAAAMMAASEPALAVQGNKRQYSYQNKPGPNRRNCAGCRFFEPPHGCSIVTGTISPNGWCTAWAAR